MICVFGLFHGLIMLPVVLCVLGPTDQHSEEDKKVPKTNSENSHHLAKRLSRDVSEKCLQVNISNLETEQRELEVILPLPGVTESLLQKNNQEDSEEPPNS